MPTKRMILSLFAAVLGLASTPQDARAFTPPFENRTHPRTKLIAMNDQRIETELAQWLATFNPHEPGFTFMARFDEGSEYSGSVGMADLAQQQPLEVNSIFNLASVSKQFTAFSILLLAQDGLLDLNDPIQKHLPELPNYTQEITIQDLIYHVGGMIDYMELAEQKQIGVQDLLTAKQSLSDIVSYPKAFFPVGNRFDYSNTGYFLLAQIIERVSGQSYKAFAEQRIFVPLGMKHTFIVDHYPTLPSVVHGYAQQASGQFVLDESPWEQTGDGAVHSNVIDLMKWGRNLSTGTVGGLELVQKMGESLPALNRAGQKIIDHENYAFGLFKVERSGLHTLEHSGGWAGYATYFIRVPSQRLSIAVLSNQADFDGETAAYKVLDVVLGQAPA